MKVTFPHLGNAYAAVKGLLNDLGIDCVVPEFNNKNILELGSRYVPEMACLPLKITVGNLIQAITSSGADTVLMAGGFGPCRFGFYCEMQREILSDIGIDVEFIIVEPPKWETRKNGAKLLRLAALRPPGRLYGALCNAYKIAEEADKLESLAFRVRPRELEKGKTDFIYNRFRNKVLEEEGSENILKLIERTREQLEDIKTDRDFKPLKIGIVGEIYTNIEHFASFDIQNKLGLMGVEVDRNITVSDWVMEHIVKKVSRKPKNLEFAKEAKPYLKEMIGGHARETIGNTVIYAKNGYDGIIQTYPLTCMPEIVSKCMLLKVQRDYDIPVLTLVIDEMTGEAGYLTRVEAFVDMLWKRRREYGLEKERVFSWN